MKKYIDKNLEINKNNINVKSELQKTLKIVFEKFNEYKSFYIQSQSIRINIVLNFNSIFHCLGLNRISKLNNRNKKDILIKIANNNEYYNKVYKKEIRFISNIDKKAIKMKSLAFIIFFNNLFKNDFESNLISIYKNISFKKYNADYCIVSNGSSLIIQKNTLKELFENCHILSLRLISNLIEQNKYEYKNKIEFLYIKFKNK